MINHGSTFSESLLRQEARMHRYGKMASDAVELVGPNCHLSLMAHGINQLRFSYEVGYKS